ETHANDAVDRPENPDQARTFRFREEPSNAEDDAAFVLAQDVQGIEYPDGDDGRRNDEQCELIHWGILSTESLKSPLGPISNFEFRIGSPDADSSNWSNL